MFLIERLLGVMTYSALLLFVCNGIAISKPSSMKKWLVFYVVALSVMAFFYQPHQSADLVRLLDYMHSWASMTPSALLEYCSHSNVPVYIAYFWLVGQAGVDGLLPCITCFIYYSLIFSGFWVFFIKYEIAPKEAAWGIAFFMSFGVFLEMISGIRSSLAIAAVFWCCVREIVIGKNPIAHTPLYLAASLTHPLGLFLTLLRFVVLVAQKTDRPHTRYAYLAISLIGIGVVFYLGPEYLNAMIDKGVSYSTEAHYYSIWETVIHIVLIVVSLSLIVKLGKGLPEYKNDKVIKNLLIMQCVLMAIVFAGFFLDYAIYHRMSTYLGMYSAMVLPLVMMREGAMSRYAKLVKTAVVVMLLLSCTRGNLSNYKFFVM